MQAFTAAPTALTLMKQASLPEEYFSLFHRQVEACKITDDQQHAELRKQLNREIRSCLLALKSQQDTEDPEIWYALGHASMFYEKNSQQATAWFQRAAEAGHSKAITKIGNSLRQSNNNEEQEQGHVWLSKASEQGDHYAMLSMGLAYRDGQGVPQDYAMAKHWFEQADQAGETSAVEQLADLHLNHLNAPAEALPYYLKAEAQGISCTHELAQIYNTRGSGVYDPIKAKEHYETLLRRGQKSAPWVMLELAKLHASGQVSDNGLTHARKWLYQIISQCPKSLSARKKAERLLRKLDESLF